MISIVICTYNRSELLQGVIKSISLQEGVRDMKFEIIIVDNNSNDRTKEVVKQLINTYSSLTIRSIIEYEQGLSHARNRGYKEAIYEYVAYLDDDALAEADWLSNAFEIVNTLGPDAFGGPIYPFYNVEKPSWFKDEYEIRLHKPHSGWMSVNETFSGSNMIWKKSVLESLDGFNPALGMVGSKVAYGEESVLIQRAMKDNFNCYYSIDLRVRHLVPNYKLDIVYFLNQQLVQAEDLFENDFKTKSLIDTNTYQIEVVQVLSKLQKITSNYVQNQKSRTIGNLREPENFFIEQIIPLFVPLTKAKIALQENIEKSKSLKTKILNFSLKNLLIRFVDGGA